jgi:hypothetical protein
MTFRFPTAISFHLLFSLMVVTASAQAQESVSEGEGNDSPASENIIEVKVETFQSGALEKFLKTYRLIWQQSKVDVSDVLKKHRQDFSHIKYENSQALKSISKNKLPKIVLKRVHPVVHPPPKPPAKNPTSASLGPDFIFHGFLSKQNLKKRPQARLKSKPLSLEERQRLGDIKKLRRKDTLRFRHSEIGRLKSEIEQGSLKEHQAKLIQFSRLIKKLQRQLSRASRNNRRIFIELGDVYLESQRYLNSLDSAERVKLTRYAPHSGISLGSYELALWTYKVALNKNPEDGDTNFLMGKIFSEIGNNSEALERVRNAEHLFTKYREPDKAAETRSFIDSLLATSSQNYQTEF